MSTLRMIPRRARRVTAALLAGLAGLLAAPDAPAQGRAEYRFEGRGWGHGIGMSQHGAHGYAQRGLSGPAIIRHYFSGTVVAPRPSDGPSRVRVLLTSGLPAARIDMTSAGSVRQGTATLQLATGDSVQLRASGTRLVVTRVRAGTANRVLSLTSPDDATITPAVTGGARIGFSADHAPRGASFRGTLTGHVEAGRVGIVNTVAFEEYLRGVVPVEMPASWHGEALRAQAIAARSYALRGLRAAGSWFDLYSDTRSQVYGGIGAEHPRSDAAIRSTAGLVARVGDRGGEVAQTFFFSTSAGRTAAVQEVFRGSSPVSYLRSVPSPHEQDSPYFFWTGSDVPRFTPSQLASRLKTAAILDAFTTAWSSGYAKDLGIVTASGTDIRSATDVRAALGLRSTYFRARYLSVRAPDAVRTGSYATFSGRVPTVGRTTLLVRRGTTTLTIPVRPNGARGAWRTLVRMTSAPLTATLVRNGISSPGITVRARR